MAATPSAAEPPARADQPGRWESPIEMELRAAWEGGDWPVMRAAAERIIAARQEPTTRDFLALARACHRLNDFEAAAAAAARACERDRSNVEALMIAASISRDRGDGDAALTYFRALGRRAPQNPRWAAEVIWLLILLGRISEAMSEVDASLARMPQQPLIWGLALEYGFRSFEQADAARTSVTNWEEFVRLIFRSPPDWEFRRAVVVEDKGADVLVAPAADANVAVLVFTGASDQMSMPLPIFDRYLATLGVTAIFLKDFERVMYLSGIRSLGKGYDSTAEALRDILGRLGATRLCTMGSSDGGYAAIRYGVTLGADRITSFDGPTHSAPEFDEFAVLTTRVAARYSREEVDLKTFLSGQAYSSQISLWHGQGSGRDKVHALHLRDCNGVTLHPVAGVNTHNVLRGLALNHDDLLPTLHGLLGLTIEA